jgi:hypothetical protein
LALGGDQRLPERAAGGRRGSARKRAAVSDGEHAARHRDAELRAELLDRVVGRP